MLRCGQNTIIFLINNGGYTIEVEIHDGPYNVIKNWNYTGLVEAIHNGEGKCWTTKVRLGSRWAKGSLLPDRRVSVGEVLKCGLGSPCVCAGAL